MLQKVDNDWVKQCMKLKVSGQEVDQRKVGEIVGKDCQAHKLNKEDVMDRDKWRKQISDD